MIYMFITSYNICGTCTCNAPTNLLSAASNGKLTSQYYHQVMLNAFYVKLAKGGNYAETLTSTPTIDVNISKMATGRK